MQKLADLLSVDEGFDIELNYVSIAALISSITNTVSATSENSSMPSHSFETYQNGCDIRSGAATVAVYELFDVRSRRSREAQQHIVLV